MALFSTALMFANHALAQSQNSLPLNDTVLHVFQGGSDGALPAGGVVFDAQGNVYGATTYGGNGGSDCIGGSCGTVYELSPPEQPGGSWTEAILYNFTGKNSNDGQLPNGGLIIDQSGNLYGVTAYGGTGNCILLGGSAGCGTVYELTPPSQPGGVWTKTTIYSFQGGNDGYLPIGNLTFDQLGNLYGATQYGGGFGSCNAPFYQYCGTVFEISPPKMKGSQWTERVLYSFKGGPDGANPNGGLIFDKHGYIYGTTYFGGLIASGTGTSQFCTDRAGGLGCGAIFRLESSSPAAYEWNESVLYRFRGNPDGVGPAGNLALDSEGKLYGTTFSGGIQGIGTTFQLKPPTRLGAAWAEQVILNFGNQVGAQQPTAGVVEKSGVLYGTAFEGGLYTAGVVFRLEPPASDNGNWSFVTVCDFPIGNQSAEPESELTFDSRGSMYGTTQAYNHMVGGSVFKVGP